MRFDADKFISRKTQLLIELLSTQYLAIDSAIRLSVIPNGFLITGRQSQRCMPQPHPLYYPLRISINSVISVSPSISGNTSAINFSQRSPFARSRRLSSSPASRIYSNPTTSTRLRDFYFAAAAAARTVLAARVLVFGCIPLPPNTRLIDFFDRIISTEGVSQPPITSLRQGRSKQGELIPVKEGTILPARVLMQVVGVLQFANPSIVRSKLVPDDVTEQGFSF